MELMHPRRLEKKANIRVIGVRVTCGRAFLRQGHYPLAHGAASGKSRLVVFNSDGLAGLRGYCAQADDEPSAKQLQLTLFSGMTRGYDRKLIRLA